MSQADFVSSLLRQTPPSTRFTSPTTSPPTLAFYFFQIWFLHWDIATTSLSALSHRYQIVYRALATVLALVLAPILSIPLISIVWYIYHAGVVIGWCFLLGAQVDSSVKQKVTLGGMFLYRCVSVFLGNFVLGVRSVGLYVQLC
ncbi:hypothetical protein L3X38_026327 [Prunus dulcis]|uniref:Uncharacterized protein n=1 Tax=Prunus dulcis TaxID=3755 RepID=A0AAD4YZ74_PRUDU|nr:hypothetical protein L3X38_026327 [Prunus dulcis]